MNRALLCLALVALCTAAPYGDVNAMRMIPTRQEQIRVQPQMNMIGAQQQDETDLVDTLGAGYSFFKKQVIGTRPLSQQRSNFDDQTPILSTDDNSNHWSDYTKASALKSQSVPRSSNNIIVQSNQDFASQSNQNGYGNVERPRAILTQVRLSAPTEYGQQQQQQQQDQVLIRSNTFADSMNTGYGQQSQQVFDEETNQGGYGQQQQQQPKIVHSASRTINSGYGQQQQQPQFQSQQELVQPTFLSMKSNNGYGQQNQQVFDEVINQGGYGQQQQQQPKIVQSTSRTINSGYGQQQQIQPQQLEQQQQFLPPTLPSNNGYGQQTQQVFDEVINQGGYGQQQQQPKIIQSASRTINSGYGQQQQQQQEQFQPQQELVQPTFLSMKSNNGYGQQTQQVFDEVINQGGYGQQQQQQPKMVHSASRTINSGYGQQQPSFENFANEGAYGQQKQQVLLPTVRTASSGYGQQQFDMPAAQLVQSGYGSQQERQEIPRSRTDFIASKMAPQGYGSHS